MKLRCTNNPSNIGRIEKATLCQKEVNVSVDFKQELRRKGCTRKITNVSVSFKQELRRTSRTKQRTHTHTHSSASLTRKKQRAEETLKQQPKTKSKNVAWAKRTTFKGGHRLRNPLVRHREFRRHYVNTSQEGVDQEVDL